MEPGSPLPAALAAELGLRDEEWVALGIRGSRLARWTRPSLPSGLRAIVVLLTANDPNPTARTVLEVDAALRAFVPAVVWLPPPPYPAGSPVHGRDRLMRAALTRAGVAWIDRSLRFEPAEWAPDQVHLTLAGYRAYARQVAPELWARLDRALGRVGRLLTPRGLRLPLSSLDAVWLARAVVGEGGTEVDAAAIASTMVRRWALLRDTNPRSPFRTLTDLVVGRFAGPDPYEGAGREVSVRGYSQPVAVQWRTGEVARRRRVRELAWDAIELSKRRAVLGVLTGARALTAPAAVHFAAPAVVTERLPHHEGWRRVPVHGASNVFVSTAASRRVSEPLVVGIAPPSSRVAWAVFLVAGAAVALGATATLAGR